MFTRIDHVGIAVTDLDEAVALYRDVYGFEVVHVGVVEEQGVREAMLRTNATGDGACSYLQLLEPTRADSPVGKFLAKNGPGLHHLAFGTANIEAAAASVTEQGLRVLYPEPKAGSMGSRITFVHPKDGAGVLVELVEPAQVAAAAR
ncbi:MAG: methylmalonyl-CoA epimerase [Kineosporiaceae bacterium]